MQAKAIAALLALGALTLGLTGGCAVSDDDLVLASAGRSTLPAVGEPSPSSSDELTTTSAAGESSEESAAPPSTAPVETTATTSAASTSVEPAVTRVNSADEASAFVVDYIEAVGAYNEAGLIGGGAQVEDLEVALRYFAPGTNTDRVSTHNCLVEEAAITRSLLPENPIFEFTVRATDVTEVRSGLWIVGFDFSQAVSEDEETTIASAAYVTSDGVIGGRSDAADCYSQNQELDGDTAAALAEATAADR